MAYEQYEQYRAQLAAYEAQPEKAEEPAQRRPDWLQEIAAKSQRCSPRPDESPAEPEPAQAVGPDGRVWDERWGYCTPEQLLKINSKGKGKGGDGKGKGKGDGGGSGGKSRLHVVSGKGGHYAVPSSVPVGPPKRGYKLQVCSQHPSAGPCSRHSCSLYSTAPRVPLHSAFCTLHPHPAPLAPSVPHPSLPPPPCPFRSPHAHPTTITHPPTLTAIAMSAPDLAPLCSGAPSGGSMASARRGGTAPLPMEITS